MAGLLDGVKRKKHGSDPFYLADQQTQQNEGSKAQVKDDGSKITQLGKDRLKYGKNATLARAVNNSSKGDVQKGIGGIRSELYDQLEGLSNYGRRESGFIIYEGENGEALASDLITGKRNSLFDGVKLGAKNGYIIKGQFGIEKTSKILEVLHTHPDHSGPRFSGGEFGDVWFAERFNFNVSLSYKGERRIYSAYRKCKFE